MSDLDKSIGEEKTIASLKHQAELQAGHKLGRYCVIKLLGRGGMGQVYLAQHDLQKSLHAIKIMSPQFSTRPGFLERFRTELQTMACLQHPNIVHVQYSDEESGLYYLVMDFISVDGSQESYDLEEALAEHNQFKPEVVRKVMIEICEGLAYAHAKGIVHRDLKPANILLTRKCLSVVGFGRDVAPGALVSSNQPLCKITDFGLAKVAGEDLFCTIIQQSVQHSLSVGSMETFAEQKRVDRSTTGSIMGTYGYMSPELDQGACADERSDVYALGVMMYRMITGQRLRGRAGSPSKVIPDLEPWWDRVIVKSLSSDPDRRYQTAVELKKALEAGEAGSLTSLFRKKPTLAGRIILWLLLGALLGWGSVFLTRRQAVTQVMFNKEPASRQSFAEESRKIAEAKLLLANKDYSAAKELVLSVLKSNPSSPEAEYLLNQIHATTDMKDVIFLKTGSELDLKAASELRVAWSGYSGKLDLMQKELARANALFERGEYIASGEIFQKISDRCRDLWRMEQIRLNTVKQGEEVLKIRDAAKASGADSLASKQWVEAISLLAASDAAVENMEFSKAVELREKAGQVFDLAQKKALFLNARSEWQKKQIGIFASIPGYGAVTGRDLEKQEPDRMLKAAQLAAEAEKKQDDFVSAQRLYSEAVRSLDAIAADVIARLKAPVSVQVVCNRKGFSVRENDELIPVDGSVVKLAPFLEHKLTFSATGCDPVSRTFPAAQPGQTLPDVSVLLAPSGGDPSAVEWTVPNGRWIQNRYADGSVTMTDRNSGLMWIHHASTNGLTGLAQAKQKCKAISYAGYNDWRLPTATEIEPMFGQKDLFTGVAVSWISGLYWTDTPCGQQGNRIYALDMRNGSFWELEKAENSYIWPVRTVH